MKKIYFSTLLLMAIFCAKDLRAQQAKDLAKCYPIVSVYYSVPDNDQENFANVDFRLGWNNNVPYAVAIQFTNVGYIGRKLKFSIKDVTSKKMIVLDTVHNSRFGSEVLNPTSYGAIWSWSVDNINDSFSLHVWDSNGDEFDKMPISIKDQQ